MQNLAGSILLPTLDVQALCSVRTILMTNGEVSEKILRAILKPYCITTSNACDKRNQSTYGLASQTI
jgi:hypothetical protein